MLETGHRPWVVINNEREMSVIMENTLLSRPKTYAVYYIAEVFIKLLSSIF